MSAVAITPRYGSAADVAAYAGVSLKTVRRMVARGAVRGLKVGRQTVIPFADVDRHILERGSTPVMTTIHRPEPAEAPAPYVPPITPEELRRRNRAAAALLDAWESEGDEAEQRETFAALKEALGEGRVIASRPALR